MSASSEIVEDLNNSLILPAIVAPMFLVSGPELVIAAGKAGLIGCFPAPNARSIEDLQEWLLRIDHELETAGRKGQWIINMIVHPSYDRFDQEMELVADYRPRFVVTALGAPDRAIDKVHAFGGKVFADVITPEHARKAVDAGADGLILVCSGAGGHTGAYSPLAFIEEVRTFWDGPLIAGGAVSSARSLMAMLTLGADFAYVGTRFISCPESLVKDEYREMLLRARMSDIVTSAAVTGVKGNWIKESLDLAGYDKSRLDATRKVGFSEMHGDSKAWKNTWGAGQGVGRTREIQTVHEIVDELASEWRKLLSKQSLSLGRWPAKF